MWPKCDKERIFQNLNGKGVLLDFKMSCRNSASFYRLKRKLFYLVFQSLRAHLLDNMNSE